MQILFHAEKGLDKIKDVCGVGGNSLGKQTYVIRDGKLIDGSGVTYLAIFGTNEALNLAKNQLKDLATEVPDPKRGAVVQIINDQNKEEKGTKLPPQSNVFSIESQNLERVRDLIGVGSNSLERQSVVIKSSEALGETKKGNYVLIEGSEDAIKLARGVLVNLATEITNSEMERVVSKIKAEEETAGEGFGSIFG